MLLGEREDLSAGPEMESFTSPLPVAHMDPSAAHTERLFSESRTTAHATNGDSADSTTMAASSAMSHPELSLLPLPGGGHSGQARDLYVGRTTAAAALFRDPPDTPLSVECSLSALGARLSTTPVRHDDEGGGGAVVRPAPIGLGGAGASVVPSSPSAPVSSTNQRLHPSSAFASSIPVNTSALSARRKTAGGRPAPAPAFRGVGAAEAPLMAAPPTAMAVAKQRRTMHAVSGGGALAAGGVVLSPAAGGVDGVGVGLSASPGASRAWTVTMRSNATLRVATGARAVGTGGPPTPSSAPTVSPLAVSPSRGLAVHRIPVQSAAKYLRGEASVRRYAEGVSQFSALDLEGSVGSPSQPLHSGGQHFGNGIVTPAHSVANVLFPSQPSQHQGQPGTGFFPATPPLNTRGGAGFTTPIMLSQQLDLTRVGGSLSNVFMRTSQDFGGVGGGNGADYSQAETEYSNIFSKRILNEFREIQELGQGAFGKVALYEETSSGQLVAVKVSAPAHASADSLRIFRRERAVMQYLNGRTSHIVRLLGTWEEGRVPQVYLQLEYCPGGSVAALAERKRAAGERWEEGEVLVFLLHMAIALDAMHSASIAHVDFKPDNVLMDAYGNYKLSDFGCSVVLDAEGRAYGDVARALGGRGVGVGVGEMGPRSPQPHPHAGAGAGADNATHHPPPYDATQLSVMSVEEGDCRYLCADMLNQKRHVKAGDMFSLGMSLYELMSGAPLPKGGEAFQQLRRRVPVSRLRERGYSDPLIQLVGALLAEEPAARPTAREVLQHLRPPMEQLGGLACEATVREWTAVPPTPPAPVPQVNGAEAVSSGEDGTAPRPAGGSLEAEREEEGGPCAGRGGDGRVSDEEAVGGSPPRATRAEPGAASSPVSLPQERAVGLFKMRRVLSATLEATQWLLESAQREFMVANGLVLGGGGGGASGRQDVERAPAMSAGGDERSGGGGEGMGHAVGRSNSCAFSPPSCVTPVNAGSPLLNPSSLPFLGAGGTFATPMRKGPPPTHALTGSGHTSSRWGTGVGGPEGGEGEGPLMQARQRQVMSGAAVASLLQQREDASTPTVLPGGFNWHS